MRIRIHPSFNPSIGSRMSPREHDLPVGTSGRAEPKSVQESTRMPAEEVSLPKVIRFEELARCGDEVWIRNRGQLYRLQQTRQGKLILTK